MSSSSFSFSTAAGIGGLATSSEMTGALSQLSGSDGFDKAELTALLKQMGLDNQDIRDAANTLLDGKDTISAEDLSEDIMSFATGPNSQLTESDFEGFLESLSGDDDCDSCDNDSDDDCGSSDCCDSSSSSEGLTDKGEEFFEEQAGLGGEFTTEELRGAITTIAGSDGIDEDEAKALAIQYLGLSRSEAKDMFEDLAEGGKISVDDMIQDIMIFADGGNVDMNSLNEWADSFRS